MQSLWGETFWENVTIKETINKDRYIFHTLTSWWRWLIVNLFLIHKAIEKKLLLIFQSIWKSPDLTNPRYIEQNFSVPSVLVKTTVHCIGNKVIVLMHQVNNCARIYRKLRIHFDFKFFNCLLIFSNFMVCVFHFLKRNKLYDKLREIACTLWIMDVGKHGGIKQIHSEQMVWNNYQGAIEWFCYE